MSDLRYDPLFDIWTVVAENRRDRPIEFVPLEQVRKPLICPFCGGNEDETPPPLALLDENGVTLSPSDRRPWTARVFLNRYPTYGVDGDRSFLPAGPYWKTGGPGVQELVIPTPRHVVSLSQLRDHELLAGFLASQQRMAEMVAGQALRHAMFFGNCRSEAGASVEHVHFQIIGSPLVSPALERRTTRMRGHREQSGRTLLQSAVEFEHQDGRRIVARSASWVMVCPFASRMPFQAWIIPVGPVLRWSEMGRGELAELGMLTRQYLTRLEALLGEPGYNWMLHQLPFADGAEDHCFVEITPRLAKQAGYELGTDIWVNPVSPEMAARRLRTPGP